MDRRAILKQALAASFAMGAGAGISSSAIAQNVLAPGKNYRKFAAPRRTHAHEGKIEVIEFFWIGCPHCRAIEPTIIEWHKKLPADVLFRKVHVNFRVPTHQRLYYTLESMKQADDDTIIDVFTEIHDRRNRMRTDESVFAWVERRGLDRDYFARMYQSFGVQTRMRRASQQVKDYGVNSVPFLAVNGKYVTSPSMAGSNQAAMRVVDALIALERA